MAANKRTTRRKTRSETRARYHIRAQAKKRGWDTRHVDTGGEFLEENETERYFPNIGLGGKLPDFVMVLAGEPVAVIEAKNDLKKLNTAITEACDYAEEINRSGKHTVNIAIGAAGEEDTGFSVIVLYLTKKGWKPLTSHGAELTNIPSKRETELAIQAGNSTTVVTVPDQSDFIDAAIELSSILRQAKIEAPLRPKVIGAMVAAMYEGEIVTTPSKALASVNSLAAAAINKTTDIPKKKKKQLIDALKLSGADFNRLSGYIGRVVTILKQLNVKAVLQTDTDFLGMFYEAFLRYGYDNNSLGIVFTPRHITRFCVELTGVRPKDRVIDIASGTGGFLVAAFDRMLAQAKSNAQRETVKSNISGFDTNPTIWALSTLNMFFRGDGKGHMENGSCFDSHNRALIDEKYTRAYLNPPFSQDEEPERMFIHTAMDALEPDGILAAVVYAGIFADDEHRAWRESFLREHTLLGMISLPEDIFYPTAAPTSIMIAAAQIPHGNKKVFMSRIWNDGYEKLKGRRVPVPGGQLSEVASAFHTFLKNKPIKSQICTTIDGNMMANGEEWSPQLWLPQPQASQAEVKAAQENVLQSIFRCVAHHPDMADVVLPNFGNQYSKLPPLPTNKEEPLSFFFDIQNGKSSGIKNYQEGATPYVSSGDATNSVIGMATGPGAEIFKTGAITLTAFGNAALQPWPFLARGNGGSSVRVLIPKFNMSVRELIWFCAQLNMQRWRFFYARMAIKGRISESNFKFKSPKRRLPDNANNIAKKLKKFRQTLKTESKLW
ncbi:N-6 DNA methylase [Thiolapillus sp.]|uniref:HsdM family class I SAM-dependent methyltransferase n=1 Tax=Thiolapillus sp. TaxID=2017437 RepID=UPI003AF7DEFA